MSGLVGCVSVPYQSDTVIGPASNKIEREEIDLAKEVLDSEILVARPPPTSIKQITKKKKSVSSQKGGSKTKKQTASKKAVGGTAKHTPAKRPRKNGSRR